MKDFYTLAELAAAKLPDLPPAEGSLDNLARTRGWRSNPDLCRQVPGKTKKVWQYHISLLPKAAQSRLLIIHSAPANDDQDERAAAKKALWYRFDALSKENKEICQARLEAVLFADELESNGLSASSAKKVAARKFNCSARTLYYWQELTHGIDRADWLAALAPAFANAVVRSDCAPEAWEFITSDFLRPEKPALSACYRRLKIAAKAEGWSPIPSEQSLRRRINAEVPKTTQMLARSGKDKAKTLYPAQRRTRTHLHAMQMVNMDGHKLDVFIRVPWSEKPVRMFLIGIQDLFSGKVVGWRLSDSENKETVRLVIGDMVESAGIPDRIYLDNGRSFASKWISGGAQTRFRFKVKEEDPEGLLVTLGIEPRWTTPYSGQSKPIERAWKDLAENISKHPFCAGAYTGNKPDAKPENYGNRALPLDEFRDFVASQIAEHNAREGRKAAACNGRSFDQTFADSMAEPSTIVRWATNAQRALWLLASETIRTKKGSGEVHYAGNRYWSRELNQHAGQKVTIRFDPDALHGAVKVYDLANTLICEAPCIEDAGFDDQEAARQHARKRRDYAKAVAGQAAAHKALSAEQLADILTRGTKAITTPEPVRPTVTRLFTTSMLAPAPVDAISEDQFSDSFSRALGRIGGASILEFPQGNGPVNVVADPTTAEPKCTAYGSKKKGGKNPAR